MSDTATSSSPDLGGEGASERTSSPDIESLVIVNEILDEVLYGTYGVNSTSVEVHGQLCARFASLIAPAGRNER